MKGVAVAMCVGFLVGFYLYGEANSEARACRAAGGVYAKAWRSWSYDCWRFK